MQQPLVSVVICAYNGEKYLARAIESVLAQTYRNFEIVIVDDGSSDGTVELIHKYAAENACVRPFFRTNHGLPASRNFAFENAKGEWVAIIDQDDLCYPTRLARQFEVAVNHPTAAVIFCDTNFINEKDEVLGQHLTKFSLPENFIPKGTAGNLLLEVGCYIDSEAFFMRRDAIYSVGAMDVGLRYACDYEYFIRAGLMFDIAYTNDVLSAWRIHPEQATSTFPRIRKQVRSVYLRFLCDKRVRWRTQLVIIKNLLRSYAGQLLDALGK